MTSRLIVAGTDTGIGKTVFAAALADALGAHYWKPVQAGLEDETDSETVARLGGLGPERILSEAHRLEAPASPHLAAARQDLRIEPDRIAPPDAAPLVIEGAGGLMVPLDWTRLQIDLFARWRLPVVLVARTALGTINHTLLSLEALRARDIPVLGVAFVGPEAEGIARTVMDFGSVRVLGRLPLLDPLTRESLGPAFAAAFRIADFASPAS